MSADHRRPVVAFVVLAFLAAAVVGIHRADAGGARFLATVLGSTGHVDGRIATDERSDEQAGGDLLEVPRAWFLAVEQRTVGGQETSASAVRHERAADPTRGQDGREGEPVVRHRGSSGPAKSAGRPAAAHPRLPPASRGALAAAEKVAEQALRDVTRRQRADGERSSGRSRRTVGRTVETVDEAARETVAKTEALVREVGELAPLP